MSGKPKIRCAIYTRKSSEEGLDQEFNSLDAQYEACAAYVASQKHEGWVLLKDRYDDGGISGGTLERPAVQRLLADIDAGKVDRVIVYKVDRLTRSLADFAKLVERFDLAGASFVSVTQSFNTATSMGRLTLNVLLSFAQFEREVTAERIRDKIAASKKKGMWMGGNVPLGYDAKDRTLEINNEESQTVRAIFDLYEAHRSIGVVKKIADKRGMRTKRRPGAEGALRGDRSFSRGHIHLILTNPVYAGRIRHKEKSYEGAHDAIISPERWDRIQALLSEDAARPRGKGVGSTRSPLAGKIHDETGDRLTPSHANKKGRRYRYYVSNRLISNPGARDQTGWRLPAEKLERAITEMIARRFETSAFSSELLASPTASEVDLLGPKMAAIAERLKGQNGCDHLASLVQTVTVAPSCMTIDLAGTALADLAEIHEDLIDRSSLTFATPCAIRRRGVETRVILDGAAAETDDALIANLAKAHSLFDKLRAGGALGAIAEREGVSRQRLNQVLKLAFLAPDLVGKILDGRQPEGLTMDRLSRSPRLDLWKDQRAWVACLAD